MVAIFDNYKVKLISFMFAAFLWFFVITENEYQQVLTVPITIVNMPSDKVLLQDIPSEAKVMIQGSGKDILALSVTRGVRVFLDLSDVDKRKKFSFTPRNIIFSRPSGAVVATGIVTPDSVDVVLDDFITMPKAKPGYTIVGDIVLEPDTVRISGPKSLLSQITEVHTLETEYGGLDSDFSAPIALAPLPAQHLTSSADQVQASINVQRLVEITMSNIPVKVKNAPGSIDYYVRPSTLSLVIGGGGDLLAQVKPDDIHAYLDYDVIKYAPGNEHPATIETPPGTSYHDIKPKTFKLVTETRIPE
jgi:YbbR domain-containing protein